MEPLFGLTSKMTPPSPPTSFYFLKKGLRISLNPPGSHTKKTLCGPHTVHHWGPAGTVQTVKVKFIRASDDCTTLSEYVILIKI